MVELFLSIGIRVEKEKNSTVELGKKEKGLAATSLETTPTSDFPSNSDKIWGSRDNRSRINEITIIGNRRSIEFLTSPPSPQPEKKDSKMAVYGVTVNGLNHEMKNGEANFVNGLADTTQIHGNKQLGLVLKLTQTIAPGPLKASAGIRPFVSGKERVSPSLPPSLSRRDRKESLKKEKESLASDFFGKCPATKQEGNHFQGDVEILVSQVHNLPVPLDNVSINSVKYENGREEETMLEPQGVGGLKDWAQKMNDKSDTLKQTQMKLGPNHVKKPVFNYSPNVKEVSDGLPTNPKPNLTQSPSIAIYDQIIPDWLLPPAPRGVPQMSQINVCSDNDVNAILKVSVQEMAQDYEKYKFEEAMKKTVGKDDEIFDIDNSWEGGDKLGFITNSVFGMVQTTKKMQIAQVTPTPLPEEEKSTVAKRREKKENRAEATSPENTANSEISIKMERKEKRVAKSSRELTATSDITSKLDDGRVSSEAKKGKEERS
ncbi:Hypothetical predicted protein [Olea europaea subsp. europaea]|uniref:Uncharacterized protein n=1 Tax=Olea europaea subsp. europaea TaxID=158383 RepID=A0A8S0RY26_OLEEU|nr:Hypothetical predicted protein [Olea europaea subsp. europaea]